MTIRSIIKSVASANLAAIVAVGLVLGVSSAASADDEDRRVRILNNTSVAMMEFYASSIASKTWEEDILGQDVLVPGDNVVINIDDGSNACRYDFKAVFLDGDEVTDEDVDVCDVAEYEFTEE